MHLHWHINSPRPLWTARAHRVKILSYVRLHPALLRMASSAAPLASLFRAAIPAPPQPLAPDIEDVHARACEGGLDTYTDPSTGYSVFTALSHLRRGKCCGNACRHCPYAHQAVAARSGDKYRARGGGSAGAGVAGGSSGSAGASAAGGSNGGS